MGSLDAREKQVFCLVFPLWHLLGLLFYFSGLTKKILISENKNLVSKARNHLDSIFVRGTQTMNPS